MVNSDSVAWLVGVSRTKAPEYRSEMLLIPEAVASDSNVVGTMTPGDHPFGLESPRELMFIFIKWLLLLGALRGCGGDRITEGFVHRQSNLIIGVMTTVIRWCLLYQKNIYRDD